MQDRPFFERIQMPEPGGTYFEVTNSGAVLAFGTRVHESRRPGGIDHGFPWFHSRARSLDRGRTWTIEDEKWWEPETRGRSASVVDRTTGEIFLFGGGTWPLQTDRGEPVSESWMIVNYEKGREMGARMFMEKSADEGRTWERVDLTEQFYTYPGAGLAWFIGAGIQLQRGPYAGRLIVPARYFGKEIAEIDPEQHNILWPHASLGPVYDDGDGQRTQCLTQEAHNAVLYSDDHGRSWQWGGSSQGFTGEACIVELSDGSVYLNNRNHDPASLGYRINQTVRVSHDDGKTWPVARRVTEEGAYSSLVALDDGTILCGLRSAVCRFNMAWLEQRQ